MSPSSSRIQISLTPTPTPCHSDNESSDEEEAEAKFDDFQEEGEGEDGDQESMEFPINGECTSLSLSPTGNFLWAGFSDGTLRVFDLTGNFGLEQDLAVSSRQKSTLLVASKWCQTFGAVACQIHARGVHTDLITQVGVCDENYVFCGVSRGAMELYAVDFGELEACAQGRAPKKENILDYLKVYDKADAKLKGFGACTKLKNTSRPTYLLLTGKGIKNIHIWSFQPPLREDEDPIWTQLYDTQTNGNTINLLGFYRAPSGNKLLGVSQSDSQKLRLWDLSEEETQDINEEERSKRPPYVDVANSQAALGLAAGGFCVCGGPTMFNQLSIVSLDQPKNAFNHTELALPGGVDDMGGGRSSRRQRRGDLKQVVNVASPPEGDLNAGQVLLELDDGTIVQYTMSSDDADASKLQILEPPTIPALPDDYWKRTFCLASSKHHLGALVVAMSLYNPNTSKGKLVLRKLPGTERVEASLEPTKSSSKTVMETPPHRQSTPPAMAANNGSSPETDLAAIKTLCMAPPKKSKTMMTDEERIKAKKEKKKKRKQEKLEALKRRSSDSELVAHSSKKPKNDKVEEVAPLKRRSSDSEITAKKPKKEESSTKRVLSLSSLLEADSLIQSKEHKIKKKKKKQKPEASEVVTPTPKENASTGKRIFVNRLKVIPFSAEKRDGSPSNSVSISSPTFESSDKPTQGGNDFETPAKKTSSATSTATTVNNNTETKTAGSLTQVSPDASVVPAKKPAPKTVGEMDRFVVSQKQLKLSEPRPRSKSPPPPPLTKEQKEKQEQLKVASVPRKSRANESVGEEMEELEEEPVVEEAEMQDEEMDVEEELLDEVTEEATTKVSAKKKRPRSALSSNSGSDTTDSKKRKAVRIDTSETDPKATPLPKKKFSFLDNSPPTREDMHATRVKAEYKRIQDLISNLPPFVPALLLQGPSLGPPKSMQERLARERSNLESKHLAAHKMIQRRMLQAAESIIRNAVDYHLSIEEARTELRGTLKSFQEVVHETLQRQRLESETLWAQQVRARGGLDAPTVEVHFPFQESFDDIEDARRAIEAPRRLPGRPRTA